MGEFPSGQRGQTVNLLLSASMVRIHPLPPKSNNPNIIINGDTFGFLIFTDYIDIYKEKGLLGITLRNVLTTLTILQEISVLNEDSFDT